MGLMIFAGGCRTVSGDGKSEYSNCNTCLRRDVCDMEPRARELAGLMAEQWIRTDDGLPPDREPILYLEYLSGDSSGTVHYGCFDGEEKTYREWPTGSALPQDYVIAWMPVPGVPDSVYSDRARGFHQM